MSMSTFDNGPLLDGWHVQPAKHCGLLCVDFACPVCGENVPQVPANIELGSE